MTTSAHEEWRPVRGYEGIYEVSDHGRVRSLRYTNPKTDRLRDEPKLKTLSDHASPGVHGVYKRVWLSRHGKRENVLVHHLVLDAFVGPCPTGFEGAHEDGDPSNNCAWNLRWKTAIDNANDRRRHGTTNAGARNGGARLTEDVVLEIRAALAGGASQAELAERYGVSQPTISDIRTRRSWSHL